MLRPGALIDVEDLRPDEGFPVVPLLLEYAGNDRTGRGHRRSNDIYVLWRYEWPRNAFVEVVRCVSQGNEWLDHMRPIAMREIGLQEVRDALLAEKVTGRVLAVLDAELETLGTDDRGLVMNFVYEQFTARAGSWTHQ